jgi:hypothetical protein
MKLKARAALFGRCFVSSTDPQKMSGEHIVVEEITEGCYAPRHCFAIELQDVQVAYQEYNAEQPAFGDNCSGSKPDPLSARPDLGIVRYAIPPNDARNLASQLLYELARSGDTLAMRFCTQLAEAAVDGALREGWWFPQSADEK